MTPEAYFIDTGYVIALLSPADRYHALAVSLARQLKDGQARLVTTRAVVMEIGGSLARLRYRKAAVDFLSELEKAPSLMSWRSRTSYTAEHSSYSPQDRIKNGV